MAILAAMILLAGQWAYTLTDQADEQHLTLRTQEGTYRVVKQDDWGCGYTLANQNVRIVSLDAETVLLMPDGDGWVPSCSAVIEAQMDDKPCFTNGNGDCDVRIEND